MAGCIFCADKPVRPFLKTRDRLDPGGRIYSLVRCSGCGLVFLDPVPEKQAILQTYPKDAVNTLIQPQPDGTHFLEQIYRFFHPYSVSWRIRQVEKAAGVGRILDVGCGNGDFLYAIRKKLWEVFGVEEVPSRREFARNTLALPVYSSLGQVPKKLQQAVDVITFWHSLDRVPDPVGTLERALEFLHPDGFLFLGLSNWRSLDFWVYRSDWASLDAPRRIFHFTGRHVRMLARMFHLEIVDVTVIPFDIYYTCLLSERIQMERERRSRPIRMVFYLRAALLALMEHILSLSGSGPGLLYQLRRKRRFA
jgi:SAM-dependent methyltransferase